LERFSDIVWTGAANHASWFHFIDAQHGWLLLGSGPLDSPGGGGAGSEWTGAPWRVGDLYRTTDGGLHWSLTALDPGSYRTCVPAALNGRLHEAAMSFSSATTGWIVATCGLLVTHDSGFTWARAITPLTPIEAPFFFDDRYGMILADGGLMLTSDGGASWSVRALPGRASSVDFINSSEGWAVAQDVDANFRLYYTHDSGRTWVRGSSTSLMMPAPKYWPPSYLHFVDSRTGFLDPGGDPANTSVELSGLFKTTDGGRTWTKVDGTVQGP
jgi:photosystem II stability/assembly factor-like uncharacterized protein